MGSSQSKPQQPRPRAHPRRDPRPEFHRTKRADYNAWLLDNGHHVISADLLTRWGCPDCIWCGRAISTAASSKHLIHNLPGCQVAYHDRCMREWLARFVDGRGRLTRPRCFRCERAIDVRPLPAPSRKYPTGYRRF